MKSALSTALIACMALGCGDSVKIPDEEGLFCEVRSELFSQPIGQIDLLFVIDTSPSMAARQAALLASLDRFARVLENIEGGLPGVHIAFVSADGSGEFRSSPTAPACPTPDDGFIVDDHVQWWRCSDDPALRCGDSNYAATLSETMQCIGALPADQDEPALLFQSMQRAVDGTHPGQSEFMREGAFLGVFFITDGDDASPDSAESYATWLRATKSDPKLVIVGAVMPSDSPRLDAWLDLFPQRATEVSIDGEYWEEILILVAELFAKVLGFRCLNGVDTTDVDADEPGLQLDCIASEIDYELGGEVLIPRCRMLTPHRPHPDNELPCWRASDDQPEVCDMIGYIESDFPDYTVATLRCVGTCE